MEVNGQWSDIKDFISNRSVGIQYFVANNMYYLFASDYPMIMTAQIPMDGSAASDQSDFETNYKPNANKPLLPSLTTVTTLYELNNKDLKLARAASEVGSDGTATVTIKIPGTPGTGDGRYIEGGYGTTEDYDKDDFALVWVSDNDRLIAWQVALVQNPSASAPVPDSVIQGMGIVPGMGIAMPNYPIVKNFYDDEAPIDNQGWYFWPVAQGNNLPPCGETEVEAIAGWAFCPSGLYFNIKYCRKTLTSGGIRIDFWWAKQ